MLAWRSPPQPTTSFWGLCEHRVSVHVSLSTLDEHTKIKRTDQQQATYCEDLADFFREWALSLSLCLFFSLSPLSASPHRYWWQGLRHS